MNKDQNMNKEQSMINAECPGNASADANTQAGQSSTNQRVFAEAARKLLRMKFEPDRLLVGELRDGAMAGTLNALNLTSEDRLDKTSSSSQ